MENKTLERESWNRGYGNFVYRGEGQSELVATCYPLNGTAEELEIAFARARLISAAPELLNLVKRALRTATEVARMEDRDPENDVDVLNFRAAITKAEEK